MKKILPLLFPCFSCFAQIPQVDLTLASAGQPVYVTLDAVRNAQVTQVRETYYEADTSTHHVDWNKPHKITLYAIGYLNGKALPVEQIAAIYPDTNTVIERFVWAYNAAGKIEKQQTASKEFMELGSSAVVQRDGQGHIAVKYYSVYYDLEKPVPPTVYNFKHSTDEKNNITTSRMTYTENGREMQKRYYFTYDSNNNLSSFRLESEKGVEEESKYTYNSNNQVLTNAVSWTYSYEAMEYIPGQPAGFTIFGAAWDATEGTVKTHRETKTNTYDYTYEYDKQQRLVGWSSSSEGKLYVKEEYIYSENGLPELINVYDDKGLKGVKKILYQ